MWILAPPQTSPLNRVRISNFKPIVKSNKVTPKLASETRSSVDSKPKKLSTKPAIKKPTMGGKLVKLTTMPKVNAVPIKSSIEKSISSSF